MAKHIQVLAFTDNTLNNLWCGKATKTHSGITQHTSQTLPTSFPSFTLPILWTQSPPPPPPPMVLYVPCIWQTFPDCGDSPECFHFHSSIISFHCLWNCFLPFSVSTFLFYFACCSLYYRCPVLFMFQTYCNTPMLIVCPPFPWVHMQCTLSQSLTWVMFSLLLFKNAFFIHFWSASHWVLCIISFFSITLTSALKQKIVSFSCFFPLPFLITMNYK